MRASATLPLSGTVHSLITKLNVAIIIDIIDSVRLITKLNVAIIIDIIDSVPGYGVYNIYAIITLIRHGVKYSDTYT